MKDGGECKLLITIISEDIVEQVVACMKENSYARYTLAGEATEECKAEM